MDERLRRAQSLVGTSEGRPDDDFYPTPGWCTRALLAHLDLHGLTWEPACGDGAISKVIEGSGREVFSTDITYRGYGEPESVDFLATENISVANIITNPPFSLALEFAEKALACAESTVCLFLKLAFLETARRWQRLQGRYPSRALVFTTRPQLTRNGLPMKNGGMIAFGWFIWEAPFARDRDTIEVSHIWGGPDDWPVPQSIDVEPSKV